MKLTTIIAIFSMPLIFAETGWAQSYPTRPIRMIVPYAPAGSTDITGRNIAQRMTANMGQQVVVDNRSGAAGVIGTDLVAKSTPDGYTILLSTNAFTANPWLYSKLPYNTEKDFAPITLVTSAPNLLAAHPSVPARTANELIALARSKPGQLTIANSGVGQPSHLASELLKQMAKIDLVVVPYRGTGASISDLVGGQVMMSFGAMPGLIAYVRAGKLNAIAIGSPKRDPALPDVPAMAETLPGFEVVSWYGMFAAANTPKEIVTRLQREIAKALNDPQLKQRLANEGFEPGGMTPDQFGEIVRTDLARWKKVIREANIRIE